ncbi:glutathione S-transferase family protein [Sneathiella aquimaris]|uniref:glutathione S-transferase family protein n=1 Tax=Sneathiella aquimaris TaxID=2599305 RepID=UPI001469E394|nr:glutathione S-transferase family protein [Sneathiella aquimaris]
MNDLHLISHHLCPYVQRAVIVLDEKKIPHKRTYIDLANKPDWFTALSPLGRVPLLQHQEAVIFESQVIAEYLDEITAGSLHPSSPLEKARHRSWIEFGSETLKEIGRFYSAKTRAEFDASRTALITKLQRIGSEIDGPFFGGATFHMIDGVYGTIFRYFDVFEAEFNQSLTETRTTLHNWRTCIAQRPSVINAVPAGYEDRLKDFLIQRASFLSDCRTGVS